MKNIKLHFGLLFWLFAYISISNESQGQTITTPDPLQTVSIQASQSNDFTAQISNITPPSPQAKLYMRYGEIPVELSSGIPNISIPIYTLRAGNLEIPISISYHASGNKVEDIASSVGLGWVLNAGGMIAQTMYGAPDYLGAPEFTSGYDAAQQFENDPRRAIGYEIDYRWYYRLNGSHFLPFSKTTYDKFSYNFNGQVGGFRRNLQTKEFETIPHAPLKIIQPDNDHIQVTDTEGNLWIFKRYETMNNPNPWFPSFEYHLEKIRLIKSGDEVLFSYIVGTTFTQSCPVVNATCAFMPQYPYDSSNQTWHLPYPVCQPERSGPFFVKNTITNFKPVLLSKIDYNGISMEFKYQADRQDRMKERLEQILIKSNGNEIVVDFYNKNSYLGNKSSNYRMLLTGMKVNDENYSFKYETDVFLPDYSSIGGNCNVDFWGYYNGANSVNWLPFDFLGCTGDFGYIPVREANPNFTKAGIIKEIIYPTKGRTVFNFEQNKGKNVYYGIKSANEDFFFGGLRIQKITNYNGNILVGSKTYEYEGGSTVPIDKWQFCTSKMYLDEGAAPITASSSTPMSGGLLTISSSGFSPITNPWGPSALYNKVTEYIGDGIINSGKTEYVYEGIVYDNSTTRLFLTNEFGYNTPTLLKTKKTFSNLNGKYNLVQEINNNYTRIVKNSFLAGVFLYDNDRVFLFDVTQLPAQYNYEFKAYYNNIKDFYYKSFGFADFRVTNIINPLVSSEVIDYTNNGNIKTSNQYKYDDQYRLLTPIESTTIKSNGTTSYTETWTHPFDYQDAISQMMVSKNIISPVIENTTITNGNVISAGKTNYKDWGSGKIFPENIQKGLSLAKLEIRLTYHNYDSHGNPLYFSKDNTDKIVILWGYNYQYPIAEIKNATYENVREALGMDPETLAASAIPDMSKVDALRKHALLKSAFVTTYTYKPLAGIATVTDPRGFTTYYEYDPFNRLKETYTKNASGAKQDIEKHEYHYKNQ